MEQMEDAKIYGLCLERLKYQIERARREVVESAEGRVLIESYCTAETEDIVDILELYDLDDRTESGLREKLEDLAYTASVLMAETLEFGQDSAGNFGLYVAFEPVAQVVG